MGVPFYGDYDTTETVVIPFNTFSSDDPSASVTITNLAAADVEIHKDGGTTQRASDNGVTVSIDFDSITGNHIVSIDLSDNSDAGFYSSGSRYQVRMEGTTVDGATINAWIGAFSVGCTLRPTTAGRTLTVESDGVAHADVKEWAGTAIASAISAANLAKLEDILDGTGGTGLTVNKITVTANNGDGGIYITNAAGPGIYTSGDSNGAGIEATSASGNGIDAVGVGAGSIGIYGACSTGYGMQLHGGGGGYDLYLAASGTIHDGTNRVLMSDDASVVDASVLQAFIAALDQGTGQIDSGTFAAGAINAAAIADGAIDAATFAADVDAEILSYIVDDATKIDASALNTLSGHDPGATLGTADAGDAMALTAGERTTLAAAIEAAIINELDGNAVMQAIADLIADDMTTGDLSVQAIASACRDAILDRVLSGNHDTAGTTGKLIQDTYADTNELQGNQGNWLTATSVTVSDKTGFKLASDGMDSVTLPADIITAASINTGAFTADAFAANALVAATFATDSITSDALADGTVTAAKLGADCITSAKIADGAFVAANFAASSLDGKGDWNTTVPDAAGTAATEAEVLAAVAGLSTLDAAGVRTAVGLASANLDTQLGDIPTVAEFEARTLAAASYFDPAADTVADVTTVATVTNAVTTDAASRTASKADVSGLATPAQVNAQVVDVVNVDALVAGVSMAEALRRIGGIASGIISGAGTGTETFKDYEESAETIVITVDSSGNRSAIAYN